MPSLSELGLSLAELIGIKKKKTDSKEISVKGPKPEDVAETKVIQGHYHENIQVEVDKEGRVIHAIPDTKTGYYYAPPRKKKE